MKHPTDCLKALTVDCASTAISGYRCAILRFWVTSLGRKRNHPYGHHRALGMVLLKGPGRRRFLNRIQQPTDCLKAVTVDCVSTAISGYRCAILEQCLKLVCVFVCVCAYVCIYVCVCMCVWLRVWVCVCVRVLKALTVDCASTAISGYRCAILRYRGTLRMRPPHQPLRIFTGPYA